MNIIQKYFYFASLSFFALAGINIAFEGDPTTNVWLIVIGICLGALTYITEGVEIHFKQ